MRTCWNHPAIGSERVRSGPWTGSAARRPIALLPFSEVPPSLISEAATRSSVNGPSASQCGSHWCVGALLISGAHDLRSCATSVGSPSMGTTPRGGSRAAWPDQGVEGRDALGCVSCTPGDSVTYLLRRSAVGRLLPESLERLRLPYGCFKLQRNNLLGVPPAERLHGSQPDRVRDGRSAHRWTCFELLLADFRPG